MIPKCNSPFDQASSKPSDENTENKNYTIKNLQLRLNHLHSLLAKPQMIHLRGFEFLKFKSVSHDVKQCVDTLFFEANIPCNWKINVQWNYPSDSKIDVHITFINYIVKERVKELLVNFFDNNYKNIIYVD
jgi:hypothetical protein